MKIIRQLLAAFSMYTRIPMPHFELKDEETSGVIMFLPLIGAIVGGLDFIVIRILSKQPVNVSFKALIAIGVPLIITGGFHVDGFMDTVDALRSYRSKEEKLEIMKDPHVGAFAITGLATAGLFAAAAFGTVIHLEMTKEIPLFIEAAGIFVISRSLAALTSLMMKKAKEDGMLNAETKDAGTGCAVFVMIQLIAVCILMTLLNPVYALVIMGTFALFTVFYVIVVNKNFGGVTGDTAGFYITLGETVAICALAIAALILTGTSAVG